MPGCFGHDEANRPKHYGHTDLKPAASTMAARWTKIVSSLRNWKYIAPVVVGGSGLGHLTAETTTAGLSEPKPRTRTEAVAAMVRYSP